MQHQRPRQHHPLQLPAGKLMRVLIEEDLGRTQVYPVKRLDHPFKALVFIFPAVDDQGLGQGAIEREARVQRLERILEHQLGTAAESQQFFPVKLSQVVAIKEDLAIAGIKEFYQQLAGGRFSAAAFARQPEALAPPEGERDIVDGIYRLLLVAAQQPRQATADLEAL